MKVLIACEFSGIVRDAFTERGHEAWSCDLLPTEQLGRHYQGDVLDIINDGWDLMIAHPPCTYLSSVQTFLCRNDEERVFKRIEAAKFFMDCYTANIKMICVENPTGVMTHIYRPADQIVHPYYFGDGDYKRTGLWLKNLPMLKHTKHNDLFGIASHGIPPVPIKEWVQKSTGKTKYQRHINTPFLSSKIRSKISPLIATAMADQWNF